MSVDTSRRSQSRDGADLTAGAKASAPRKSGAPLSTPRVAGARAGDLNGIYGTRSAHRRRVARRRRIVQNVAVLSAIVAATAAWLTWQRGPRAAQAPEKWHRALPMTPSGAPEWTSTASASSGRWLLPSDNGRLFVVGADGAATDHAVSVFSLRTRPVAVDEHVFVACQDGGLYAMNWRSGRRLWTYRGAAPSTTRPVWVTWPSPAASTPMPSAASNADAAPNGRIEAVIAGDDEGVLTALRARDGKVLWRRALSAPIGDGLSAAQSQLRPLVLVPLLGGVMSRGGLLAVDARTGREVWRYPNDPKIFGAQLPPPAVDAVNGRVFCVDDSGAVACLALASGRKQWKTFVPALPSSPSDAAVVLRAGPTLQPSANGGGRLFVGGNDGGVRCLDARNGRILWRLNAGGALRGEMPLWTVGSAGNKRSLLVVAPVGAVGLLLDVGDGRIVARLPGTGDEASRALVGVAANRLLCIETKPDERGAIVRELAPPTF